ncbi:hypothetical protein JCM11251_003339 [Rhodosporidiobolus azoricus]
MLLPTLLSSLALLALPALTAASSAHDAPHLGYHAHTAFLRNGTALAKRATTCPVLSKEGQIIAAYVPAWTNGAVKTVPWDEADMAFWFCTLTSQGGIELAPGMTVSAMQEFVKTAKDAGSTPLLTVGGWSGSVYFSSLVSTSSSRTAFANTLLKWVTDYGFQGVDLDWEFVGRQGAGNNIVSSKDAENYLAFLKVLRQTLGAERIIAGAVPASGINGADGSIMKDTSAFAQYFDYIVLMAYDFYGAWSATTGPNAALHICNAGSDSAEATVERWLASGFPACKMLLGIPSYSHSFSTSSSSIATTTYNGKKTTAFQAQGSGTPVADGTTVAGLIAAGYLSTDLSKGIGGYTRYYDSCTETPFLFNPSTKSWITYDDEQSWAAKAKFAKEKGLAGIAVYESTGPTSSMWDAVVANLDRAPECSASSACSAKERPVNSNAFCDKGVCSFHSSTCCRSGFTLFNGACLSTATTTTTTQTPTTTTTTTSAPPATKTCAASNDCANESRPANSNPYCKNGSCSFRCRSGFTLSGNLCLDSSQTSSTTTTTSAPAPTKTCAASNDCASCRSGFTLISTECVSSSASTTTTFTTSAPPAVKTCTASNDCCRSGYTLSGDSCVKSSARRLARSKREVKEEVFDLFGGEVELLVADEGNLTAAGGERP